VVTCVVQLLNGQMSVSTIESVLWGADVCSFMVLVATVSAVELAGAAVLSSRPALATTVNNADNGLVVVPLLELACGVSSMKTSAGTLSCSLRTFAAGVIAASGIAHVAGYALLLAEFVSVDA